MIFFYKLFDICKYYFDRCIKKQIQIINTNIIYHIDIIKSIYDNKENIDIIVNKNAKIGMNVEKRILNIYFIGTNDMIDLCENINIIQKDFLVNNVKYGKVHSGFLDYYYKIKKQMFEYIQEHYNKFDEINFYGHSLGSVCVFAAFEMCLTDKIKSIKVRTFGSPKLGNYSFTRNVDLILKDNIRVALKNDLIVSLPGKFLRYFHCGREYKILNDGFFTHSLSYYRTSLSK